MITRPTIGSSVLRQRSVVAFASVVTWWACLGPAEAHHSFAAYDMTKNETAKATIKDVRWAAPHSALVFVLMEPGGHARELTTITSPPATYLKQGIPPKSLHVGDKVEITWHPNINGSAGGALEIMKLADGRTFTDMEAFKPDLPVPGVGPGPGSSPSPPQR
jgi:Family of unknown function (DUF6152)